MKISPYLTFDGRCEEAFAFYEQSLGAKIVAMMPHEGTPIMEHVPAEWGAKILHAQLAIGDQILMASDAPPGRYQVPQGFSVSLVIDEPSEAETKFHALADGGQVMMPIGETFWALRFGMLVDRFGIPWMINCDRPQ